MTVRLHLICHASTSAARAAAFPADEPLDAQSLKKIAAASYRPASGARCWSSPALRAVQTAEALRLDATVEPALRECDYGCWTGRSLDDLQAEEPEAVAAWLKDPASAPHGGETLVALIRRVSGWLDRVASADGTVVAVTHASIIRAAIVCAIEAEPRSFWRIDVSPLFLTRLNGHSGRWTLASMNADLTD